jgi:DNA-binding IclR family transcriptional regulator
MIVHLRRLVRGCGKIRAHRYLVSYCRGGLIEQEGESERRGLGRFALDLGLAALGRLDGVNAALPVVREPAKRLDQTVAQPKLTRLTAPWVLVAHKAGLGELSNWVALLSRTRSAATRYRARLPR